MHSRRQVAPQAKIQLDLPLETFTDYERRRTHGMMTHAWKLIRFLPLDVQSAIKRHTSDRARIFLREFFGAGPQTIPNGICTVSDGRRFHIGPDWIYWAIHMGLDFEPEPTALVRRLLREGDTVVDVGANFGWYTTLCAQHVGTSGRVFAFEPVPATYDRLIENLALNGLDGRVTAIRAAVAERSGETTVYVFDRTSHACASLATLEETSYRSVRAEMVDLDSFLDAHRVKHVNFLKCDVEGSELAVLKGCGRLLRSGNAPIILVELNATTSRAFGFEKRDIWRCLSEFGYDHFFDVRSARKVRRLTDFSEVDDLNLMLCAKRDVVENRLRESSINRNAA
jgi:FkbM family methyltransferase